MSPSTGSPGFSRSDRNLAVRAATLALSAWVAFALASLWHVEHAYWAAMPVWVVAQASRGVLLERAFFRVVGTLLGAAAGFGLLLLPVPPYAKLALLGLWVAASAGLTHLLRGVHGYGALLAGITAPIVVVPSVLAAAGSRELALARVECTLIGVLTATVITGLMTPRSPRQAFFERVRRACGDAAAFAARVLRDGPAGTVPEERRILAEISELEASSRLVLAGSLEGYRRLHDVDSMVVGALSLMGSALALAGDGNLEARDRQHLPGHLERVAAHLHTVESAGAEAGFPPLAAGAAPSRLADGLARILDGDAALCGPDGAGRHRLRLPLARLAPHREWPQSFRTGLLAGGATFLACALALGTGWPLGILLAFGVSIFSMVLGSMTLPQDIAPKLLTGVLTGAFAAVIYRIAVQPAATTTPWLLLSIAPFLLLGGVLRAHPRTAIAGVDFNMCFLLASQAGSAAVRPGTAVLESLALATGAALMAGGFMLLPRRAVRQAREAAAVIRNDLRRMVEPDQDLAGTDWRARSFRQILRLALHLGRAKELGDRWPTGLLATLNLGHGIEQLHLQPAGLPTKAAALVTLGRLAEAPREVAGALRRLADTEPADPLGPVLRTLATDLEQAEGLLRFGLA